MPSFVDKHAMVQRWEAIYRHGRNPEAVAGSIFEVLPHANHELADERLLPLSFLQSSEVSFPHRAQERMCALVVNFLTIHVPAKQSKSAVL